MATDVLLCARSWTQAQALLGLSWDEVHHIVQRAVARGLTRRQLDDVRYLGIDEKNFGSGRSYISILTDLEQSRVLEVVEERTQQAAEALWDTLTATQRARIEAVAMDMWGPFMEACANRLPEAEIVHDNFGCSTHITSRPGRRQSSRPCGTVV
jgi:transposase